MPAIEDWTNDKNSGEQTDTAANSHRNWATGASLRLLCICKIKFGRQWWHILRKIQWRHHRYNFTEQMSFEEEDSSSAGQKFTIFMIL